MLGHSHIPAQQRGVPFVRRNRMLHLLPRRVGLGCALCLLRLQDRQAPTQRLQLLPLLFGVFVHVAGRHAHLRDGTAKPDSAPSKPSSMRAGQRSGT